MNNITIRARLRKRKEKESETSEQREVHRVLDRENKRVKRAAETAEQREVRLRKRREQYHKKKETHALKSADVRLNRQDEPRMQDGMQDKTDKTQILDTNECHLPESDRNLLLNFRTKVNDLTNNLCTVCNERFPFNLIQNACHRCNRDKNLVKKFSASNNMDPGDVPEDLQGLTEIEQMLISRIFPVISVYCLRGGQYAYRGNVINFPQDVSEFVTRLPRIPSSLDVLIVRRNSANGVAFRDFTVRRNKVIRALYWLKENNRYYTDIVIDKEVLHSLPENGAIDDILSQLDDIARGT